MNFIPGSAHFFLEPGSGAIEQAYRGRRIIRRRTIQHQRAAMPAYGGTFPLANSSWRPAQWNRRRLRILAKEWALGLTAGQRTAWDAFAPATLNGFDAWMEWSKIGGPAVGDPPDPDSTINVLPFTNPPASNPTQPDPLTINGDFLSDSSSGGPRASLIMTGVTLPRNYRAYATLPGPHPQPSKNSPLIALADGSLHLPTHNVWSAVGDTLFFDWPNGLPNPQLVAMTANLTITHPFHISFNVDITTSDNGVNLFFTQTAGAGLTQVTPWTVRLTAFPGTYPIAWTLKIDDTGSLQPGFPDNGYLVIFYANLSCGFTNITATTPDGQTFHLADVNPVANNQHWLFPTRNNVTPQQVADFTPQWQRIMGQLPIGQNVYTGIRVVDPTTAAHTIVHPLSVTIA